MARAGVWPRSFLILLRFPPFQHRALLQPPLTQLLPPPRVGRTCDTTLRTHPMTREEEPTPSDALGTSCRGLSPPTSHHVSHRPTQMASAHPFTISSGASPSSETPRTRAQRHAPRVSPACHLPGASQINPTTHEVSRNVDSASHHAGKATAHHNPPRQHPLSPLFCHPDQLSIMCCHHPRATSLTAFITLPGKTLGKMCFPWKRRCLRRLTPSSSSSRPRAPYVKAIVTVRLCRLMVMGLGPPSRRETQLIFLNGRVGVPELLLSPC